MAKSRSRSRSPIRRTKRRVAHCKGTTPIKKRKATCAHRVTPVPAASTLRGKTRTGPTGRRYLSKHSKTTGRYSWVRI